ncbi:MAG: hypothetical protein LBK95_13690 [Bifidobacteriaceae bacterium]|jgi:hypothetical protein|nr:hypothetical protein [Bifidobacteriaceae bacterium]
MILDSNKARKLVCLAGAAIVLAGCSQPSVPPADTAGGTEGPAPSPAEAGASGQTVAQEWIVLADDTPLGKYRLYLAGATGEEEEIIAGATKANDDRQAVIADCMKQSGFTYHQIPYGGPLEAEDDLWLARSWQLMVPGLPDDRATVEKWGYGISPEAETPEDWITDNRDPKAREAGQKNEAYMDSLSPEAQRQYRVALVGYDEVPDGVDPVSGGCVGKGYEAVPQAKYATDVSAQFEDLYHAVVEVTKWEVGMDPEALALDSEFAACIAKKGVDLSSMVFERDGEWVRDVSNSSRESPAAAFEYAYSLREDGTPTPRDEEFSGLQAFPRQVEIALADFDCRAELDYMNRIMAVQNRVEKEFVEEHRSRLDELEAHAKGG